MKIIPITNKVDHFRALVSRMANTYELKNASYGDSFGISVKKYGLIAALTRMSDKFNRIENLVLGADNKVDDESLIDTLLDMACYSIMTIIELENPSLLNYDDITTD